MYSTSGKSPFPCTSRELKLFTVSDLLSHSGPLCEASQVRLFSAQSSRNRALPLPALGGSTIRLQALMTQSEKNPL